MSVTITSRTALTTADNAADFVAIDDTSAGTTKKITPDNLRDSMLTGSALTTVDDTTLTASRAVVSNASGQLAASDVTAAELGYLDGVTSAIQPQINGVSIKPNLIHNPNFAVWSKGTAFTSATTPANNDDTYLLPHWLLLGSVNDAADVSQVTASPPEDNRYVLQVDSDNGTSARWGMATFLEAAETIPLRGKQLNVGIRIKTDIASDLRIGILEWTGAVDAITSDVVDTWGDLITLSANWALCTGQSWTYGFDTTTSWATYDLTTLTVPATATVGAAANNLAVFLYHPFIASPGQFDIAWIKLEESAGAAISTFEGNSIDSDETTCQRVHLRLSGDASANGPNLNAYAAAGSDTPKQWFAFPTTMRTTPIGSVNGTWALTNCTGPTLDDISAQGASMVATATGAGMCIIAPNGTDDYLDFDAGLGL